MGRARNSPLSPPLPLRARWLALAGLLFLVPLLALLVLGSVRYGGPEGLLLRVQTELVSQKPHPQWVPTPLPTPTGSASLAFGLPTPEPTLAPSATAGVTPSDLEDGAAPASRSSSGASGALSGRDAPVDSGPTGPTVASRDPASDTLPLAVPADVPARAATEMPTSAPPVASPIAPAGDRVVQLAGLKHYWQTWNNCGPATLTMNLSYYGSSLSQADVAAVLKPDRNDKNVSPHEMAAFVQSLGYNGLVRVNGDADRLRRLVDANVPVLIETWLDHDGGMGHYRLVTGYEDARDQWIVYDSYVSEGVDPDKPYAGIRIPYEELADLWRVFNRTYVLIFQEAQAPLVAEILGEDWDETVVRQKALARARDEVQLSPDDAFAWFNLGSSLVALDRYAEAAVAFDRARVIGLPWRMLWYQFGPFQAYFETGRYAELVALADATIATAGNVEETFYWRGRGLQALGDLEGARQAYRRAVELNPNYGEAQRALGDIQD